MTFKAEKMLTLAAMLLILASCGANTSDNQDTKHPAPSAASAPSSAAREDTTAISVGNGGASVQSGKADVQVDKKGVDVKTKQVKVKLGGSGH